MRQKIFLVLACFLLVFSRVFAQEECSEFVQSALETAQGECAALGLNQACFGNVALNAVGQPDVSNFQFSSIGDIEDVVAIQSMQLSGYDRENGVWGLVMMQLQANVPNTLPGQNVTIVLFGDVTMQNAASSASSQNSPEQELALQSSSDVTVRAFPSPSSDVLGIISPSTHVIATGISQDGAWVRIRFGAEPAWLPVQSFGAGLDASLLAVISNPSEPAFAPMQAFYLTTGIGRPSCNQVPDDGMLVQTPQGVASITLFVNEVSVEMGSSVYFSINAENSLEIAPVKGSARVTSQGETRTIVEGAYIEVPMDDEFRAAGEPSEPQSYLGDEDVFNLPYTLLDEEIVPDEGLSAEELEQLENLEPVLEFVNVEDADDLFNYLEDTENPDLVDYLLDAGYKDFGDDVETYLQEDLGYDLGNYEAYTGDDGESSQADNDSDSQDTSDDTDDASANPTEMSDDTDVNGTDDSSGGDSSGGDSSGEGTDDGGGE